MAVTETTSKEKVMKDFMAPDCIVQYEVFVSLGRGLTRMANFCFTRCSAAKGKLVNGDFILRQLTCRALKVNYCRRGRRRCLLRRAPGKAGRWRAFKR
jgi:hypothetical protein